MRAKSLAQYTAAAGCQRCWRRNIRAWSERFASLPIMMGIRSFQLRMQTEGSESIDIEMSQREIEVLQQFLRVLQLKSYLHIHGKTEKAVPVWLGLVQSQYQQTTESLPGSCPVPYNTYLTCLHCTYPLHKA